MSLIVLAVVNFACLILMSRIPGGGAVKICEEGARLELRSNPDTNKKSKAALAGRSSLSCSLSRRRKKVHNLMSLVFGSSQNLAVL